MKKKKVFFFSFLMCLFTLLISLNLNKVFAENTVSSKTVDTITSLSISTKTGEKLGDLGQWVTFRLNANFNLAGKNVKAGDTTTVELSDLLYLESQNFEIRDTNTNEIIATGKIDDTKKNIIL